MKKIVLPVPNGVTDQTEAIQKALDGGDVLLVLPAGVFPVSHALTVYSNTKIMADEHTVVYRVGGSTQGVDDCLLHNAHEWKDGEGDENIEIEGGVWNMNNAENRRGQDIYDGVSYGGLLFRFTRVKYLSLRDMTLANADTYFVRLIRVSDFRIINIKFYNSFPHINQDGIHLNGYCFNGVIKKLRAISPYTPGDDMVALNADDGTVTNHNHAIELGPIENIDIEDLYAESAWNFVRILSIDQTVKHVRIKNLRGGVMNNFLNIDSWKFPRGKGAIEDVEFSGMKAFKVPMKQDSPAVNKAPLILIQLQVKDFVLHDFERIPIDALSEAPTLVLANEMDNQLQFEPRLNEPAQLDVNAETHAVRLEKGGFQLLKIN